MIDQQTLIDQITKEVVGRLQGQASGTAVAERVTVQPSGQLPGQPSSRTASSAMAGGVPSRAVPAILTPADVAKYIDHTLLKPEATAEEIEKICNEASEYHFYSVCINSNWVPFCAKKLRGTDVKVCAVVGFPLGAMDSRSKSFEARHAIENGAQEIDMVMNVGAMKSGDLKTVEEDIKAVRRACRPTITLKVILETVLLTDDEKVTACQIAKNAGADFVKTSTGFSRGGATVKDVALMRRTVGPKMGVKAAGGIHSFEEAKAMIEAGATRIGASSGVAIVTGQTSTSAY